MTEAKETPTTRREVIVTLAATGVLAMAATAETAQAQTPPRTFVLVHGAYEGGWIWRYVADRLRAKGHKVFTPTHTGLGERSHLMSGMITLETHVTDVANVIKWERLENVVLTGHSYGGWVISGVVERMLPKIASIVYVDAFLPENGQKGLDLNSPGSQKAVREAIARGEVSRPPDYSRENSPMMTPQDREWLVSSATPQPIGVSLQPLTLTGARDKVAKKAYIRPRISQSDLRRGVQEAAVRHIMAALRRAMRPFGDDRHAGPADGNFARDGVTPRNGCSAGRGLLRPKAEANVTFRDFR